MDSPIRRLASLPAEIAGFGPGRFSEAQLLEAKLTLVDTMACHYITRADRPELWAVVSEFPETASGARIWWSDRAVDASNATFTNALLAHASDFDSVHYATGGHPGVIILPALDALRHSAGIEVDRVLQAYLLGLECMAHLADAVGQQLKDAGHHLTSTLGAPATAAACAWAVRGRTETIRSAMALACSAAGGSQHAFGGTGKAFQVASAARIGYDAARFASKGCVPSSKDWCLPLTDPIPDTPVEVREFWFPAAIDLVPTHFKQSPVCAYFDEPVGLLLDAFGPAPQLPPFDRVEWEIPTYIFEAHKYEAPSTLEEARFSLTLVAALILEHGTDWDARFQAIATAPDSFAGAVSRIRLVDNGRMVTDLGETAPSVLRLFNGGSILSERQMTFGITGEPKLRPGLPMRKLRQCNALGLPSEATDRLLADLSLSNLAGAECA
ncbi:MmgE/PrpD family protein [Streptomyces monashensis]|uniref:MmgE/PrpD family protein n=1 Tax=Streptomyces monashensis TaxID=1678012 RepID=UPI0011609115|nr:MmgE/PrpD family protein [Streptomyces monashensis]